MHGIGKGEKEQGGKQERRAFIGVCDYRGYLHHIAKSIRENVKIGQKNITESDLYNTDKCFKIQLIFAVLEQLKFSNERLKTGKPLI